MAVSVTIANVLASGGAPSAGNNVTASWTPGTTKQYLLAITSYVSTGSVSPVISNVTGNGLTWTLIDTIQPDNTGADRTTLHLYAARGGGGSAGTITIAWSTAPTRASWVLDEVTNGDIGLGAGTLPQADASGTVLTGNPSATLGSSLKSGSVTYAAAAFESSAGALSAGSGYTTLGTVVTQSLAWILTEWDSAGSTSASASNSTNANRHGIILVEIACAQFAHVGSTATWDTGNPTFTPNAVGNLITVCEVTKLASTPMITGLSSSNVTWTRLTPDFATSTAATPTGAAIWVGKVTSASAATVTITWAGGSEPAHWEAAVNEFSSVFTDWALDTYGTIDSNSNTAYPSLTPAGPGELYVGIHYDDTGAVVGSTAGYTYEVTSHANGALYNAACTSSAQAPTWGGGTVMGGIAALIKQAPASDSGTAAVTLKKMTASAVGTNVVHRDTAIAQATTSVSSKQVTLSNAINIGDLICVSWGSPSPSTDTVSDSAGIGVWHVPSAAANVSQFAYCIADTAAPGGTTITVSGGSSGTRFVVADRFSVANGFFAYGSVANVAVSGTSGNLGSITSVPVAELLWGALHTDSASVSFTPGSSKGVAASIGSQVGNSGGSGFSEYVLSGAGGTESLTWTSSASLGGKGGWEAYFTIYPGAAAVTLKKMAVSGTATAPLVGAATVTLKKMTVTGTGYAAIPPLVQEGVAAQTLSPSLPKATQAGNLLVAWLGSNDSGASPPFSTTSPGWVIAFQAGAAFQWFAVAYKENCSAGETAPTFSDSGGSVAFSKLAEFSGMALSSVLDQTGGANTSGTSFPGQASAGDSKSGDLIIGGAFCNSPSIVATASATMTDSSGASVTVHEDSGQPGGAATVLYDFVWGVAGGTTGSSGDEVVVTTSAFTGGTAGIASFKTPSSGVSGTAAVTLKKMTAAVSGNVIDSGTAAVTLNKMTVSASGSVYDKATSAAVLKKMSVSGTGTAPVAGTGVPVLKKMTTFGQGKAKISGTTDVTIQKMTTSGFGFAPVFGTAGVTMPKMQIRAGLQKDSPLFVFSLF